MNYQLNFHPEALSEYLSAGIWYEYQKAGLSARFEEEIEKILQQIADNPYSFSIIKGAYRQARTSVFPFVIVYKANERAHEIYISAIYHAKRNPRGKFRKP